MVAEFEDFESTTSPWPVLKPIKNVTVEGSDERKEKEGK
jgi:hypothetical protein